MDARAKLVTDIRRDIDEWYRYGRRNNLADIGCTVAIVVTSMVATILGAADAVPAVAVAAVAALPAAAASLQRSVDFRGRAAWYFRAGARLRKLMFEVEQAAQPDLEDFARRRGRLEVELEEAWGTRLASLRDA